MNEVNGGLNSLKREDELDGDGASKMDVGIDNNLELILNLVGRKNRDSNNCPSNCHSLEREKAKKLGVRMRL